MAEFWRTFRKVNEFNVQFWKSFNVQFFGKVNVQCSVLEKLMFSSGESYCSVLGKLLFSFGKVNVQFGKS